MRGRWQNTRAVKAAAFTTSSTVRAALRALSTSEARTGGESLRLIVRCYFRDSYGQQQNWSEPPAAHTIGNTTIPAEAWGVMVLYNGAGGVSISTPPTRPTGFRCPWIFNPTTGAWTFHDNQNNYGSGRVRPELEGTINTQE